jgi:hypothetical protein
MRMPNLVPLVVVSLLVVPSVGFGESLAEAAAKEKARRKALADSNKKPAKSYSDTDLGNAKGTNASFPSGADTSSSTGTAADKDPAAPGAKKEKTEDEKQAEASAAWRKSLDAANTDAATYRDQVAKIQSDMNDTSAGLYSNRRATMATQLEDAKRKQAEADAKVADLQEQGRRNGYR